MTNAPYVLLEHVKTGDTLVVAKDYDAFTCLKPGDKRTVFSDSTLGTSASLYICCVQGKHYLDGQLDLETGELIGLVKI